MTSVLIDEQDRAQPVLVVIMTSHLGYRSAFQYESTDECQHPVATKTGTTDGPKDCLDHGLYTQCGCGGLVRQCQ